MTSSALEFWLAFQNLIPPQTLGFQLGQAVLKVGALQPTTLHQQGRRTSEAGEPCLHSITAIRCSPLRESVWGAKVRSRYDSHPNCLESAYMTVFFSILFFLSSSTHTLASFGGKLNKRTEFPSPRVTYEMTQLPFSLKGFLSSGIPFTRGSSPERSSM